MVTSNCNMRLLGMSNQALSITPKNGLSDHSVPVQHLVSYTSGPIRSPKHMLMVSIALRIWLPGR